MVTDTNTNCVYHTWNRFNACGSYADEYSHKAKEKTTTIIVVCVYRLWKRPGAQLQAEACSVLIEHVFGPLLSMQRESTHSLFVQGFLMQKSPEFSLLKLWHYCHRHRSSFIIFNSVSNSFDIFASKSVRLVPMVLTETACFSLH